ncbi:riboflavin biosynthesis protein RibT [Eupransor demetentiae]|uniref:Ribosomal protein S18 acetylase RimI and related acetyltransferases (RimI) n=1 Tax=Eupransor demetentiae TaxID=3109584 RepID=A0ABP0ESD0_9LACO|nr:Ribosomal protein S18 acetylase RimI and related acetyltransferases (RimI) [Lactobacillaceae bacterium LMG 33000]
MLIVARQDDEKTVMGILSLLPGLKEISHLKTELDLYQGDDRHLYVWQETPQSQIQGVLGVQVINPNLVLVRHIILTPGARTRKHYYQMLSDYQEMAPQVFLMGGLDTQKLISQWRAKASKRQA